MVTIDVDIKLKAVYDDIFVNTYYRGEALKKKDADNSVIQASTDDKTVLRPLIDDAVNELARHLLKRVNNLEWYIDNDKESIIFTYDPNQRNPCIDAEKASFITGINMKSYIVWYVMSVWLKLTAPQESVIAEAESEKFLQRVISSVGMKDDHVRRRATDLAGI